MTLDQAKRGSVVRIVTIGSPEAKSQLVRMGISEGSKVICQEKLPFGPVVLRCNRQEIAIGRKLACKIEVR
jgi:Fe2+ transport system protein FeoA